MVRFIVLFIEVCRFIEHNLLKAQGKMISFIARLCHLTMMGLAKEFLTKTATVMVSQSVLLFFYSCGALPPANPRQ